MRGWRTSSMSCIDETFERLAESEEASKHATQRTKRVERNGVELKEAIDKCFPRGRTQTLLHCFHRDLKGGRMEREASQEDQGVKCSSRARGVGGVGGLEAGEQQATAAILDTQAGRHTEKFVQVCERGEV